MSAVGLRVNEIRGLDLADVKWDLGRFGKHHVRVGKGARGSGPRERMVPLITDAGRTLRWFVEDVWSQFDHDHAHPGAPLFPSERHNVDGTAARVGNEALRAGLAEASGRHLPDWPDKPTPHVLRHYCASPALPVRDGPDRDPRSPRPLLDRHHDGLYPRAPHPCRRRLDHWTATRRTPAERTLTVKSNLRLAAANRGVWKASELQRMLAEHGLVISAGKMSGLWSGQPASIKLDDLDIICGVLGCEIGDLLIPEPGKAKRQLDDEQTPAVNAAGTGGPAATVTLKRRDGRSLPPA
jgi:DNA-binding Xre family transcriptional regulator